MSMSNGIFMSSKIASTETYTNVLPFLLQKDAEVWATLNPKLTEISSVGCPLAMTPAQHWPQDIARNYFGNKTIFGILRDPYERLVAFFRGSAGGGTGDAYGGDMSNWTANCDVNGAINHMLTEFVEKNNSFVHGCTFLPQSEYYKGEFGIKIAVDNRMFPMSANKLFEEHGYDFHIETADCLHVHGCNETWAAALAPDTRELVRTVYKEDFDLICETFGYCDRDENTCIQHVPQMCPQNMTKTGPNYDGSGME